MEPYSWRFNLLIGTVIVESLIYMVGIVLYIKTTKPKNRIGKYGFWSLAGLLIIIYFANLFGPPPPDPEAIAWAGQLQWLLIGLGYWVDRNRLVK